MKKYILTMSQDAIYIFKEIIIEAEQEPTFWQCYELAQKYECDYFSLDLLQFKK
jgi:hypothetical protein